MSEETEPGDELRVLAAELRDAIHAAHADGLSAVEISEAAGISVEAVENILATT